MCALQFDPCLDSDQRAEACRQELEIPLEYAAQLGRSAVEAARRGFYTTGSGNEVDWSDAVEAACGRKQSIPPETDLSDRVNPGVAETRVQVANETTLGASARLAHEGARPLALNFANGVHPGGGFLHGARAQEEVLCRSSALYLTLENDPMYTAHAKRELPDATDWAIYSPDVPVFRTDAGDELDEPWLLSFLTCAAPYAPAIGQPRSGDLLKQRIGRVLEIANFFQYTTLVLGAWGCGAFRNDPRRTAEDFRRALDTDFAGHFERVVFAVTDWSPERRFLGPFRDVFSPRS